MKRLLVALSIFGIAGTGYALNCEKKHYVGKYEIQSCQGKSYSLSPEYITGFDVAYDSEKDALIVTYDEYFQSSGSRTTTYMDTSDKEVRFRKKGCFIQYDHGSLPFLLKNQSYLELDMDTGYLTLSTRNDFNAAGKDSITCTLTPLKS